MNQLEAVMRCARRATAGPWSASDNSTKPELGAQRRETAGEADVQEDEDQGDRPEDRDVVGPRYRMRAIPKLAEREAAEQECQRSREPQRPRKRLQRQRGDSGRTRKRREQRELMGTQRAILLEYVCDVDRGQTARGYGLHARQSTPEDTNSTRRSICSACLGANGAKRFVPTRAPRDGGLSARIRAQLNRRRVCALPGAGCWPPMRGTTRTKIAGATQPDVDRCPLRRSVERAPQAGSRACAEYSRSETRQGRGGDAAQVHRQERA